MTTLGVLPLVIMILGFVCLALDAFTWPPAPGRIKLQSLGLALWLLALLLAR